MRLINIFSRQEQDVVCEVQNKGTLSKSKSTFISDFLALGIVRNELQLFISSWVLTNCHNSLNKLRQVKKIISSLLEMEWRILGESQRS